MKPGYTPDNTRSSVVVILLLAAGVTLVALLVGLSDKPDVQAIGISVTADEAAAVGAPQSDLASSAALVDDTILDEASFSVPADAGSSESTDDPTAATDSDPAATAIAVTPIPIATATPAPTPEIAAAVDTTELDEGAEQLDELDAALSTATITPGTIAGQFFTRPDEDDGATVTRNELTITLNEDGTGTFAGVLEMALVDSTQVQLAMSGPIRWSTDTPQVETQVSGTFALDAPIDADDLSSTTADLTISSLGSGSGSLCPDTCYGFTFPPQTGL